jgi:hypothetical protein
VGGGTESDYDDAESALSNDSRTRRAIEVHCPDVATACCEWDHALNQTAQAENRLEEKIKSEVHARFDSPWLPEWIVQVTLNRVKIWARTPGWEFSPLRINHNEWRPGEMATDRGDYADCAGYMVLYKKGLTDEEVRAAEDQLNDFVASVVEWSEALFLKADSESQTERMRSAQLAALEVLDRNSLPRNGGCPLC